MTAQQLIINALGGLKPRKQKGQAANPTLPEQIRAGFDFAALEALQARYQIPLTQLQVLLDISDRTLARRREQRVFSKSESDRLYRVARLAARAEEVLGSGSNAARWLKEPMPVLGGVTPLSLLDTDEGAQMVGNILGRIEHGVFS
jgi:putative toxin-antitoxin system antitoxin component (TIGR02293 family)